MMSINPNNNDHQKDNPLQIILSSKFLSLQAIELIKYNLMSIPDTSTYQNFSNQTQDNQCNCSMQRLKQAIKKIEDQQKLTNHAKKFVCKIRNRKKQFQGKMLMLKRAEQQKRIQEEKRLQAQILLQRQVEKSTRKLRAQRNIQFFNQRKNIRQSNSNSPKKRRLSNVTQQLIEQNEKLRLPSLYEVQLSQIKQQVIQNTPLGLKKTSRKPTIKRSLTEHSRRQISEQMQPLKRVESPIRKRSQQAKKQDNEKKQYLIKRNRTEQISQYIQRFTQINKLIETKSKKSWVQSRVGQKRITPRNKNFNDFSISSRSRNIE